MGVDFDSMVLGADLSHYQLDVDFEKLKDSGVQFVILKATQGSGVDPLFRTNVAAAAKANLPALAYTFLQSSDTDATVANFLTVTSGMVPALDWEAAGVSNQVVERWIDGCQSKLGRPGLVYRGIWPPARVTPLIASWPWWLAEYASEPRAPAWDGSPNPDWSKVWMLWQFTGNGHMPGVTTAIDLDRLACPFSVFQKWLGTGVLDPWSATSA